jgi:hypothetical protein
MSLFDEMLLGSVLQFTTAKPLKKGLPSILQVTVTQDSQVQVVG